MRIVAGQFKGQKLEGPVGSVTRPTSDKVREALFSILGEISGARMLDLFAGTGAVGLEALSRGADQAVLVERDRRMFGVLARNVERVLAAESERASRLRGDAIKYLSGRDDRTFDLVYLDPPYARAEQLAEDLASALPARLAPGARVVTESDRRHLLDLTAGGLVLGSEHRYGDTLLRIFHAP